MTEPLFIYMLIIISAVSAVCIIILLISNRELNRKISDMNKNDRGTAQDVQNSLKNFSDIISQNQRDTADAMDKRLADLNHRFSNMAVENEQKLENIRKTMEERISDLTKDNNKQLELMRNTVDEKLQKTLNDRINQSFKLVSDRLEAVYKGLGEMQNLAAGVGDLKKVLSNVKTRGILGEVQLGAILEQILTPEQYAENINVKGSGGERVEFAVRLPGNDDGEVWLPIDAKFPGDAYGKLMDAYEIGDAALVEEAGKNLEKVIKSEAKDIRNKYIEPPKTTDFAIMFLPFEGLYAEVVRRGLLEELQRDYKVNIAGPTTMAALLNSLQMGFRTLAIQKHSGEVWNILGAVKTEFSKFGEVLEATQKRLTQAGDELDKLIGTRTNKIISKLKKVTELPESVSGELLDIESDSE